MTNIPALPHLMVAPNGARRTKQDHPRLPITIEETVTEALACYEAGADGIHLHVRDSHGKHTLDAGLYRELLGDLAAAVPELQCQITTEAVGIYTPKQQRDLVCDLSPKAVSISIAEMCGEGYSREIELFYLRCVEQGISVQHILYGPDDLRLLDQLHTNQDLKLFSSQILFVLGRYSAGQESSPEDLNPFLSWLNDKEEKMDWAVCAFGKGETRSLKAAHKMGGKLRVGFENSLWNADGSTAQNNAQRVAEIANLQTM